MRKISAFIDLLKFHYQVQFAEVLLGAFLISGTNIFALFPKLIAVFITSHILLYGGLYTINDIKDINEDKADAHKKARPLPSGRISINEAWVFAVLLISSGIGLSYYIFGARIFIVHLAFLVLNLLYTYLFKRIPFVEILGNTFTHPLRFYLGVTLANGTVDKFFLIAYALFVFGFAFGRRLVLYFDGGSKKRVNLNYYTPKRIFIFQLFCFILILCAASIDRNTAAWLYRLLIVVYILATFSLYPQTPIRQLFRYFYLR